MADERRKLCIKTGDGFGFTGTDNDDPATRKLTVVTHGNIMKTIDGLYVDDLKGPVGLTGGSTVDNYSVNEGTSTQGDIFPEINRSVCCYIYSLCAYTIDSRSSVTIVPSSTVKTVSNIISEYNGQLPRANIVPRAGELLQLMSYPVGASVNGGDMYEDFKRYPTSVVGNGYKTLALFIINEITYTANNGIASMKLTCLYSSLPNFTRGTMYY